MPDEGKELFAAFLRFDDPQVGFAALRYHDHWKAKLDAAEQSLAQERERVRELEAELREAASHLIWHPNYKARELGEGILARIQHNPAASEGTGGVGWPE